MIWIKRIITIILTIIFAVTITFFVIRTMPGDPVQTLAMNMVNTQAMNYKDAYEKSKALLNYDPDIPMAQQYVTFIKGLSKGNLGMSMTNQRPVIEIIAASLPWTLLVLSIAISIAFSIGVTLGMYVAWKRKTWVDPALSIYAAISTSLPDYIVGFLLVLLLSSKLRLFPGRGAYSAYVTPGFNIPFILSVLYYACLPVLTYVVTGIGGWALAMKGSAVSVLGEDYIMSARARGISEQRIRTKYVGRNAILPLVTSLTITFGMLFGGSPLVENLFAYPGIGFYLNQAIGSRDFSLMQGLFLMVTLAVVVANLIADMLYARLDPRIRERG